MVSRVAQFLTPWTLAALIMLLAVVTLWPTWASLNGFWLDSTRYSHGHLIVAISAYLLYRLKGTFDKEVPRPNLLALVPVSLFLFIWLVAVLASIQAIHQIMLPLVIWSMCLAVLGWYLAKKLILVVAYLYLAIPVWESGNFVLQWLTVKAVEIALWVFGIPAYIHGNFVSLPAGSFEIAGGCSGLHYFIIGIAISVLYSALFLRSIRRRVALVGIAIGLALLTNWVRVFIIVYAGHISDMQHYLVTQNHYYFGWVLFLVAMLPFVSIARRFERLDESDNEAEPLKTNTPRATSRFGIATAFGSCVVLLIAVTGTIYAKMPNLEQGDIVIELPEERGGWISVQPSETDWQPHFVGPVAEAFSEYHHGDATVSLYMNLYRGQTQGRELVGYENKIEGVGIWSVVESRARSLQLSGQNMLQVRELKLTSDGSKYRLVYYWYEVDGKRLIGGLHTKLVYGLKLLLGRPDAGATVVAARCDRNCDSAHKAIEDWIRTYLPVLG